MGLALSILGFLVVAITIRRSLGHGLGLLLAIGSIYGIVRCRVFDGYSHFLFDASLLGAYLGAYPQLCAGGRPELRRLRTWIWVLGAFPFLMILLSPMLDGQPLSVQLIGLRAAMYFIPTLLFGALLERTEAYRIALWAAGISFLTAMIAGAEYVWGVDKFFPFNEASTIIFISQDVGPSGAFRIPSTFSSAHAYGGTMLGLIPLLVLLLERTGWRRWLGVLAIASAVLGIFASAARTPVLGLVLLAGAMSLKGFQRPAFRAALLLVGVLAVVLVSRETRLQRFETLGDSSYVASRIGGSVNIGFFDVITEYPLGKGLGSAVGTSIPYFLLADAKPQIGMESEFARIALEQGVLGLLVWVVFIGWILLRNPLTLHIFGAPSDIGMWVLCVFTWAQGFIGTGLLAAVPGTLLLFLYSGALVAPTERSPIAFITRAPIVPLGA